jgi:hypothetical protein
VIPGKYYDGRFADQSERTGPPPAVHVHIAEDRQDLRGMRVVRDWTRAEQAAALVASGELLVTCIADKMSTWMQLHWVARRLLVSGIDKRVEVAEADAAAFIRGDRVHLSQTRLPEEVKDVAQVIGIGIVCHDEEMWTVVGTES